MPKLGNWRNRGNGGRNGVDVDFGADFAVGVLLRAVARDMASLSALVAGLASGVERPTIGSRAVARNVSELAAGIALHSLSLAITGKVIRAAALIARGRAGAASESTTAAETAAISSARNGSATAHGSRANGVRTGALEQRNQQHCPSS